MIIIFYIKIALFFDSFTDFNSTENHNNKPIVFICLLINNLSTVCRSSYAITNIFFINCINLSFNHYYLFILSKKNKIFYEKIYIYINSVLFNAIILGAFEHLLKEV